MNQIKNYLSNFKTGTKTMFKEFFNKKTNKKQRANMWTFSRLIIALIIPILTIISIINNSITLLGITLATTSFGALTDFFDGRSARKYNSTSEFGKNLDTVADKAFATSLGVSLSLLNPLFIINIIGEIAIGLTNIIYIIKNPELNINSSKIGKFKQWPLSLTLILGILSILIPSLSIITNIAIYNTFIIQLVTLANYIKTNNKQIKDIKKKIIIDEHNKEQVNNNTEEKTLTKEKEINSPRIKPLIVRIENNEIERKKYNVKRRVLKKY